MSEGEPKTSSFRIRGHHLREFARLLRTKLTIEELAEEVTQDILGSTKPRNGEITDEIDTGYIEDVLGKSPEERRRFTSAQVSLFRRFVELPDDFPVELGTGKDNMCDTCIVGSHCLEQDSHELDDKDAILYFLDELKKGKRTRLPIHEPGFRVLTTIGVVRSTLRGPYYDPPVTSGNFSF